MNPPSYRYNRPNNAVGRHGLGLGHAKVNPTMTTMAESAPPSLQMMTEQLQQAPQCTSAPFPMYRCLSPTTVPFPSLPTDAELPVLSPDPQEVPPIPASSAVSRRSRAYSTPNRLPEISPGEVDGSRVNSVNDTSYTELSLPASDHEPSTTASAVKPITKRLSRRRSVMVTSAPTNLPLTNGLPPSIAAAKLAAGISPLTIEPRSNSTLGRYNSPASPDSPVGFPSPMSADSSLRQSLFQRSSLRLSRLARSLSGSQRDKLAFPDTVPPVDYAPHQYFTYSEFIQYNRKSRAQRALLAQLHWGHPPVVSNPSDTPTDRRSSLSSFSSIGRRTARTLNRHTWHVGSPGGLPTLPENTGLDLKRNNSNSGSPRSPKSSSWFLSLSRPRSYSNRADYCSRSAASKLHFADDKHPIAQGISGMPVVTPWPRRFVRKRIPFASARSAYSRDHSKGKPTPFMTLHRLRLAIHDFAVSRALTIIENELRDISTVAQQFPHEVKFIFLKAMANRLESVALALYKRGFPTSVNATIAVQPWSGGILNKIHEPVSSSRSRKTSEACHSSDNCISSTMFGGRRNSSQSMLPTIFMTAVGLKMTALVQVMLPQADLNVRWMGLTPLMLAVLNRKPGPHPLTFTNLALLEVGQDIPTSTLPGARFPPEEQTLIILTELLAAQSDASATITLTHLRTLCRFPRFSSVNKLTQGQNGQQSALANSASPALSSMSVLPTETASQDNLTSGNAEDQRSITTQPTFYDPCASPSLSCGSRSTTSLSSVISLTSTQSALSQSTLSSQPGTLPRAPLATSSENSPYLTTPRVGAVASDTWMATLEDIPGSLFHANPECGSGASNLSTFRVSDGSCLSSSSSSATVCMEHFTTQRTLTTVVDGACRALLDSSSEFEGLVHKCKGQSSGVRLFYPLPTVGRNSSSAGVGHTLFDQNFSQGALADDTSRSEHSTGADSQALAPSPFELELTVLDLAALQSTTGSSAIPKNELDYVHALLLTLPQNTIAKSRYCLIWQQDLALTLKLLEQGVRLHLQRDIHGNTPLQLAARAGLLDLCLVYLWLGLDPNDRGQNGWTPLHEAMSWGHRSVALQLISQGARLDLTNKEGYTPVQLAVLFGHGVADIQSMIDIRHLTKVELANVRSTLEFAATTLGLPNPVIMPPRLPLPRPARIAITSSSPSSLSNEVASAVQIMGQTSKGISPESSAVSQVSTPSISSALLRPIPPLLKESITKRWSIPELGSHQASLSTLLNKADNLYGGTPIESPQGMVTLREFLDTGLSKSSATSSPNPEGDVSPTFANQARVSMPPPVVHRSTSSCADLLAMYSLPTQLPSPIPPGSHPGDSSGGMQSLPGRRSADATWGHPSSSLTEELPFPTSSLALMTVQLHRHRAGRGESLAISDSSYHHRLSSTPDLTRSSVGEHRSLGDGEGLSPAASKLHKLKKWTGTDLKRSLLSLWPVQR
ncbi:hypothetical protein IWQ61_003241 [Dispira simplex]|nr:hypothetical protein IWQ61_003241 [Dispira simplex]